MATNANLEFRAMSPEEIDAVAGGATALIEVKLPGARVTTVIDPDVSGLVIQYGSGDATGKKV